MDSFEKVVIGCMAILICLGIFVTCISYCDSRINDLENEIRTYYLQKVGN